SALCCLFRNRPRPGADSAASAVVALAAASAVSVVQASAVSAVPVSDGGAQASAGAGALFVPGGVAGAGAAAGAGVWAPRRLAPASWQAATTATTAIIPTAPIRSDMDMDMAAAAC